jgi:hypothetical protein
MFPKRVQIADSAREKVSEVLRVRVQQIARFGILWMEAWHRVTVMPGRKGAVCGTVSSYSCGMIRKDYRDGDHRVDISRAPACAVCRVRPSQGAERRLEQIA